MKGYKAYEKGLVCRGKQYKIGEIFEEERAEICDSGIHYCENPLDCLEHYPLIDNQGNVVEITEVEDLDFENRKTDDDKKYCTTKLKIGKKLTFSEIIELYNDRKFKHKNLTDLIGEEQWSKIANFEDEKRITNSGNYSQISNSGDFVRMINTADSVNISSSGHSCTGFIAGDSVELASSGYHSEYAIQGNYTRASCAGNYSRIFISATHSRTTISGNFSKLLSSGNYEEIANVSEGSHIISKGNHSNVLSSGNHTITSSSGTNCVVVNIGRNGMAKAKKGSWITLAEYDWDCEQTCYVVKHVITEHVDGLKIKEETFYELINGKFKEVK